MYRLWRVLSLVLLFGMLGCERVDFKDEGNKPGGNPIPSEPSPEDSTMLISVETAQMLYNYGADTVAYVVGYIVGTAIAPSIQNMETHAPFSVTSNFLLADHPNETNPLVCLPVRLANGSAVRAELNLADHPDFLGRRIVVLGLLEEYFRVPGIREPLAYGWVSAEDSNDPGTPSDTLCPPVIDDIPQIIPGGRATNQSNQ